MVVTKDLDPGPHGSRANNVAGKNIYIYPLKYLALDLIKLVNKPPLLLFSKAA
jgi:hypothetical protein